MPLMSKPDVGNIHERLPDGSEDSDRYVSVHRYERMPIKTRIQSSRNIWVCWLLWKDLWERRQSDKNTVKLQFFN